MENLNGWVGDTTDEKLSIEKVVEKLKEVFGEEIASPEHEPIVFNHQVSIAKAMLEQLI